MLFIPRKTYRFWFYIFKISCIAIFIIKNLNKILKLFKLLIIIIKIYFSIKQNGDWGLGIGDWGLGIGPNPQSPIPKPQSPIPIFLIPPHQTKNKLKN